MRYIIYLVLASMFFSSCGTQKKMVATRQALAIIKQGQENENKRLNSVATVADAKRAEGKIDSSINLRISSLLKRFGRKLDSARQDAGVLDSLLSNKSEFRKKYKSFVLTYLDSLKIRNDRYADRELIYQMVEEGLNKADYQIFGLAAFFGSGKYTIPDDKMDHAMESFAPIIDSLIYFSNRYKNIPRTGTLVILGFADGAGFSDEGGLLDTLTALIGKKDVSKEELNQKLSELRATELSQILTTIYTKKWPLFKDTDKLHIECLPIGKGEEYPFPNKKDYTVDDERRRIVLFYWSVLPD